jgi:hypothetical protein
MQELRFVAVSEDGSYAVLAVPGRSGRYILPIDERLRAVALGQTSRLAQYEIEVESPLRPKEIQSRIRAGETAEEIADAAGIPVERVRWFEGPVLAERAYIADQAQSGSVRRAGDGAGPGPRLGDIVTERLTAAGSDPTDGQWDSRKRGDGNWQVSLTFPSAGRLHVAEWVFDPRRRHVMPDDDNAARLSLPESELPAAPVPVPGEATVTPIASRLATAAGMGGAPVGGFPGASRFRPDKSVIPDRSLGVDRSLAERPAAMPDRAAAGLSDRAPLSAPAAPAPSRTGQLGSGQQGSSQHGSSQHGAVQQGAGQQGSAQHERPARPGYAEFPESAPYRAPEPSAEPRAYEDPAALTGAFRAPVAEPPTYREYDYQEPRPTYREPVGFRSPAPTPAPEPPTYRDYDYQDPRPAYREPQPEAPAYRTTTDAPASEFDAAARGMVDSGVVAPPRRVVFEDPEPTFFDEDLGPATEPAPVPAAQPESAVTAPVAEPEAAPQAVQHDTDAAAEPVAEPATEPIPAALAVPAALAEPAAQPILATETLAAAEPVIAEPAVPAAVAPAEERTVPEVASPAAKAVVPAAEATTVEAAEPVAEQVAVAPEPTAEPEPAAEPETEPAPELKAAEPNAAEPKAAEPEPELKAAEAQLEPEAEAPAEEQPANRRGAKKNPKARRSSVPSWDEIMLGSSRQRD